MAVVVVIVEVVLMQVTSAVDFVGVVVVSALMFFLAVFCCCSAVAADAAFVAVEVFIAFAPTVVALVAVIVRLVIEQFVVQASQRNSSAISPTRRRC